MRPRHPRTLNGFYTARRDADPVGEPLPRGKTVFTRPTPHDFVRHDFVNPLLNSLSWCKRGEAEIYKIMTNKIMGQGSFAWGATRAAPDLVKQRFVPCQIGEQSRFPHDNSGENFRATSVKPHTATDPLFLGRDRHSPASGICTTHPTLDAGSFVVSATPQRSPLRKSRRWWGRGGGPGRLPPVGECTGATPLKLWIELARCAGSMLFECRDRRKHCESPATASAPCSGLRD